MRIALPSSLSARRSGRSLLGILAACLLTLGLSTLASAVEIGNVDGVWGSPTPPGTTQFRWCYGWDNTGGAAGAPTACSPADSGIQGPPSSTDQDENQFRYGGPPLLMDSGDGSSSGYGFNGNDNVGTIVGETPFYLGRFTHYNFPISAGTPLTDINLTVTVTNLLCNDGMPPSGGSPIALTYHFTHEETSNDPAAHPGGVCPYGNTGGNGCNDRVTISTQPDKTFTCSNGEYTVRILGFYTGENCHTSFPGGSATTSFITAENLANSACLWAKIAEPLAVQMNFFGAEWVNDTVQISWETVSEMDNLGFNLYRSLDPTQLGERINDTLIPSQGTGSGQGYSYTVEDAAVVPGQSYWYTLEDVDISGGTTQHGPVNAVPQVPTAVTLGTLHGQSQSALPWLAVGIAALGAALIGRRARWP